MTGNQQRLILLRDKLERLYWEYNALKNEITHDVNISRHLVQFMSNDELYKSQKVLEQIENIAEKM